jgi:peptidoglycan hydrolase-like protein with peptidoglycan-binding domain
MPRLRKTPVTGIEKALPKLVAKATLRLGSKGAGVAALQDYLLKYGFLTPQPLKLRPPLAGRVALVEPTRLLNAYAELADHAFSSLQHALEVPKGEFDRRTSTALKEMQRFHGLKLTGVLDAPTRELLNQARYDHHPDIPLFAVAAAWDHTDLTYEFVNSGAKLADVQARAVIRRAFQTWQEASKLTFREVNPGEAADMKVKWARRDHGDGYPFDGPWGILAHGFFPPPRGDFPGDLHIDDDENWRDDPNSSPARKEADLVTAAAHEIGHCLGLDHSRDQDALMYSYYLGPRRDPSNPDLARLSEDDVQGLKTLYP